MNSFASVSFTSVTFFRCKMNNPTIHGLFFIVFLLALHFGHHVDAENVTGLDILTSVLTLLSFVENV